MYRVRLTDEERQGFQRRARAPRLPPRMRDRMEMVRLSDYSWSPIGERLTIEYEAPRDGE